MDFSFIQYMHMISNVVLIFFIYSLSSSCVFFLNTVKLVIR